MKTYRWTLRKGSKKEICPQCGKKRFVPYVLSSDSNVMAGPEFGRCDREQNCGYHKYPNGIVKDGEEIEPQPKVSTPIEFSPALVCTETETRLFDYAADLLGYEAAKRVWYRYHIGRFGTGTLFWEISKDMQVRAGKVIQYGANGHRIKTGLPVLWLHKSKFVQADGRWFTGEELRQCFFGEHLLAHDPECKMQVCIVESEKTAALMSELEPFCIWLACGGSQNLKNPIKNRALKGRRVILYPDNGQFNHWLCIAHANGWECDSTMERIAPFEGADILDYYEIIRKGEPK